MLEELDFIRKYTESHPKTYQLWHHRQLILEKIGNSANDLDSLDSFFEFPEHQKNYHAWQYRQWILKHFQFDIYEEIFKVETLIRFDPYNNSAWNHRFFLHFCDKFSVLRNFQWWINEVEFSSSYLRMDIKNSSAKNYISGLLTKARTVLPNHQLLQIHEAYECYLVSN